MKTKFLATLGGTACLVALALATLSPAGAQLVCQYGILDLTANGGINPNTGVDWQAGDPYRLAFHTVGMTGPLNGTSNDPDVYNAYVTAEAHANPALVGSTWYAMVTVNLDGTTTQELSPKRTVLENTGTGDLTGGFAQGGAGFPVYAMDGTTCIARNNADIWNSWSNPFEDSPGVPNVTGNGNNTIRWAAATGPAPAAQNVHYSPFLDQFSNQTVTPDNIHGINVATGCNNNGAHVNALGDTTDVTTFNRGNTNANNTARIWNRFTDATSSNPSFYAISEPLTVQVASAEGVSLRITPAIAPDTGYDLEWESRLGKLYNLRTNTDLADPIAEWDLIEGSIAAAPPTNTYNVESADPRRFYAVEEFDAPPP